MKIIQVRFSKHNFIKNIAFYMMLLYLMGFNLCNLCYSAEQKFPYKCHVVKYDDAWFFNDEDDLALYFNEVDDSRCPSGLQCFWEGEAKVGLTLSKQQNIFSFYLDTHHNFTTTIDGYKISLCELFPYPSSSFEIEKSEYEVYISVIKIHQDTIIKGIVLTSIVGYRAPVKGAKLSISKSKAISDADGEYTIINAPVGSNTIVIETEFFEKREIPVEVIYGVNLLDPIILDNPKCNDQCAEFVSKEIKKWDINEDKIKGLAEAIDALKSAINF